MVLLRDGMFNKNIISLHLKQFRQ